MATVTWSAGAAGNWSVGSNWSTGIVPVTNDDVVFNATSIQNCTIDIDTAILNSFTLTTAYTGTLNYSGHTISVNGNFSVQAPQTFVGNGSSTINLIRDGTFLLSETGGAAQPGGAIKFGSAYRTLSGACTFFVATISAQATIFNFNNFSMTVYSSSISPFLGNCDAQMQGSTNTLQFVPLGSSQNADLSALSAWVGINFQISNDGTGLRTLTLINDLTISGFINVLAGATVGLMTLVTNGYQINCGGLNIQTSAAGTATVDLTSIRTTINCSGNLTVGNAGITAANFNIGSSTVTIKGNFTISTLGTVNAGTGLIKLQGNYDSSLGTINLNGGPATVEFAGINQTIKTSGAYGHLTQNFGILKIDLGSSVTCINAPATIFGLGTGNSKLYCDGLLDLGTTSFFTYDYASSLGNGPSGRGVIQNGQFAPRWGATTQTYTQDPRLTMNCSLLFNGINPQSTPITLQLGGDLIATGDITINASNFSAGNWTAPAFFKTNGFKLVCNNFNGFAGGTGNGLVTFFTVDFGNSFVKINGNLTVGTTGDGFTVLNSNTSNLTVTGNINSWTNGSGQVWPQGTGILNFPLITAQSVNASAAGASIVLPNILINGSSTLSFTSSLSTLALFTQAPNQINITNGMTWTLPNGDALVGEIDFPLVLRSSVPGSQWNLVGTSVATATSKLVNVDIKDANATSGIVIYAFTSVDSGNNLNINFRKSGLGQVGTAFNLVDLIGNALVTNAETLSASSAKTANASYTADLSVYRSGSFICDVTAWVGGTTPTIQFIVEALDSNSGKWVPIATPAAGTASAVETVVIVMDETTSVMPTVSGFRYAQAHPLMGIGPGQNYRVRTVITGAPTSVTFSVSFLGRPV